MKRNIKNRIIAGALAILVGCSSLLPGMTGTAADLPASEATDETRARTLIEDAEQLPDLDEVIDQLQEDEIVTFEDYYISVGEKFDVQCDYTGLIFDDTKVKITFQNAETEDGQTFDYHKANTYKAVYYVEPVSGNVPYRITRNIVVQPKEAETQVQNHTEDESSSEDGDADPDPDSEHEINEQLTEEVVAGEITKDTIIVNDEDNGVFLSVVPEVEARSRASTVNLVTGEIIPFPSNLGTFATHYFEVNGKVAYCLESAKPAPPSSSYVASEYESNLNLQKILYYGYGGPGDITGSYLSSLDWRNKYVFTHIAASYAYIGTDGFYGCSMENVRTSGLWDFIQHIFSLDAPPKAAISLSPTSTEAYENAGIQRTPVFKLTGHNSNFITVPLPSDVTYHSGGSTVNSGNVKIPGGTSFYFSAPMTKTGTWSSGKLSGQMGTQWKTMVLSTKSSIQDIGYGAFFEEPNNSVSFSVKWMDYAKVKLIKQDATTNVKLAGAIFGIYADKGCTKLIKQMPATNANGVSEVEIPKTQATVYLKEITAKGGYKINTTAYNVNLVAGGTTTTTVGNKEQKGRITVHKQGEELVDVKRDKVSAEFIYSNTAYAGAKYNVYAAKTIYSQDEKTKIHNAGDLVATLTTGANGSAVTGDLYLGEYRVVEQQAPQDLVIGKTEAERTQKVTLSYAGQTVELSKNETTYTNERPKVNVKAVKKSENDSVTLKGAVFGLFSGSDIKKADGTVLVSKDTQIGHAISDKDGNAVFNTDIPIGYKYYIRELRAPELYYKSDAVYTFDYKYTSDTTYTYKFESIFKNEEVRGEVHINKIDIDAQDFIGQGDASLAGAKYGLYAEEDIYYPNQKTGLLHKKDELVAQGVISSKGTLDFKNLYLGKYYVKEIEAGTGYLVDSTKYPVNVDYEGQDVKIVHRYVTVKETVKKQAFQLLKISEDGEQTEVELIERAGFKVFLISELKGVKDGTLSPANGKSFTATDFIGYDYSKEQTAVYYENGTKIHVPELFTDNKGYLLSPELPYGQYIVFESTTPENLNTVNPFIVDINEDSREPQVWRVFDDRPFQFFFKVIKKDGQTQQNVLNNSSSYKIFDVAAKEYVEMTVRYPKVEKISVFSTNEEGYLMTPEQLKAGTYRIEEVKAPELFVQPGFEQALDFEGTEIPLNQPVVGGKYKDAGKAAIEVTVDSNTAHQVEEETGKTIIIVEQHNDEAVGSLKLTKKGEQLVDSTAKEERLTTKIRNGLAGLVNKVSNFFFDEDAMTVVTGYDFTYQEVGMEGVEFAVYAKDTIYSPDGQVDENGKRIVRFEKNELVEKLVTDEKGEVTLNNLPVGAFYLKETKTAPNHVIDSEVKEFEISYHGQEVAVDYVTMELTNKRQKVEIEILKSDSETKKPIEGVMFGLYNAEEIKNAKGEIVLEKDTLIELASTDAKGQIRFAANLPHGKYYAVEVEPKPGYLPFEDRIEFDATYQDAAKEVITLQKEVENHPTITEFTKVDMTDEAEIEGAELQVIKDGEVIEEWVSGKEPHIIYGLEPGDYILHESLAAIGYLVAADVEFTVEESCEVQKVVMKDERAMGRLIIQKTDADSGESLEGVEFTLTEKDGDKEAITLVTDKDGRAESGLLDIGVFENGELKESIIYLLKESKPLDGYKKNEEVYEITFEYKDDETPVIEVLKEISNQKITEKKVSDAPKTGDSSNMVGMIIAVVTTGCICIYIGWRRMRKRKNNKI